MSCPRNNEQTFEEFDTRGGGRRCVRKGKFVCAASVRAACKSYLITLITLITLKSVSIERAAINVAVIKIDRI